MYNISFYVCVCVCAFSRMNLFFLFVDKYIVHIEIIKINSNFNFFTNEFCYFSKIMDYRQEANEVLNTYGFFVSPEELK